MIEKLYKRYQEYILYLLFGVGTTIVNILSYAVSTRIFHIYLLASTVIAWFLSVIFAYVTNRKYVYLSQNNTTRTIVLELASFVGCRLLTGAIDFSIMYLFVKVFHFNDLLIKILSNIFVIVSNYIAGKLIIFKNHKTIDK